MSSAKKGGTLTKTPSERQTEKNVFKPLGEGETSSKSRAERYLQKSSLSEAGSPKNVSGAFDATARSRTPSPKTPKRDQQEKRPRSTSISSKPKSRGGNSVSKRSLHSSGSMDGFVAPEILLPEPRPRRPRARDRVDWSRMEPPDDMADKFFATGSSVPPPGGYSKCHPVRQGMTFAPQNPEVQKDLLAYLHHRKVPHTKPRRPIRSPRRTGSSASSLMASTMTSMIAEEDSTITSLPPSSPSRGAPATVSKKVKLASSATQAKDIDAMKPKTWLEELQQERKPPAPPSEYEVYTKMENLKSHRRDHSFTLGKKNGYELAELAMYHNQSSRRCFKTTGCNSPTQVQPSHNLKELSSSMSLHSRNEDETAKLAELFYEDSMMNRSESDSALLAEPSSMGGRYSRQVRPMWFENLGPLAMDGKASKARMVSVAEKMKHAGPSRVMLMAKALGISAVTGTKRTAEMY
eukprot:TRINITY_DN10018_c0_g1_i1.p1 TRINITY_DN10018_c0_g1~~TRINITY_DN10018_c0_g1_i1.p1  ORF type:complete len:464 (+),score=64.79 TRINITY_DN10018_c0_g1_i1:160-1551(+)